MRKAVVSTPAGINGLPLTPGRDVIVAATGPEMAQAIRSLFEDPSRRQTLEAEARRTVERDFDWNAIVRRQAAMYTNLRLNRPPGGDERSSSSASFSPGDLRTVRSRLEARLQTRRARNKHFGNTLTTSFWRLVETHGIPALGIITGRQPRRARFRV